MISGKIVYLITFLIIYYILIETTSVLAQENPNYVAKLDGSQVSPKVNNTNATGIANFIFNKGSPNDPLDDQLMYNVSVSGIKDVTLIELHSGAEGFNGTTVIELPKKYDYEKTGILSTGNLTINDPFKDEIGGKAEYALEVLHNYMNSNEIYIDIHTKKYPEGEIRGQIHPES